MYVYVAEAQKQQTGGLLGPMMRQVKGSGVEQLTAVQPDLTALVEVGKGCSKQHTHRVTTTRGQTGMSQIAHASLLFHLKRAMHATQLLLVNTLAPAALTPVCIAMHRLPLELADGWFGSQ
jgi:hypothetical protein